MILTNHVLNCKIRFRVESCETCNPLTFIMYGGDIELCSHRVAYPRKTICVQILTTYSRLQIIWHNNDAKVWLKIRILCQKYFLQIIIIESSQNKEKDDNYFRKRMCFNPAIGGLPIIFLVSPIHVEKNCFIQNLIQ